MPTVTNIVSLNQLVNNIKLVADYHEMINGFQYGEAWEFYQSGVTRSPEMWLTCTGATRERGTTVYNLIVYLADNVKRGEANELEVESDLVRIAEDVIATLKHPHYGWSWQPNESINLSIRTERTPKSLTVVEFPLSIRVKSPDNCVNIPYSTQPIT